MKNLSKRKRLFDIIFSVCTLIVCMPILLILALLTWITSGDRKVIYSHERVGCKGKPFRCYKFRTMYPDADQRLKEILEQNPKLKKEWDKRQKLKQDPRITPFGSFLRRTSLDELPQFWNVLRGDLSVVGPRPVVQEELSRHFGRKAEKILSIRPGITGIWQTSGRSHTSYAQRLQLDEKYVDSSSLMLDIKLIAKTIPKLISSKDAY